MSLEKMGFAQSVLNTLILCEFLTLILLAIPFPLSLRKFMVHAASVSFAGLGVGAAMTVAVPFVDSITVFLSNATITDPTLLTKANIDLYRGLLVFSLLLVVLVQRFQVSKLCKLETELRSARLNLEVIKKQATSASAESLRMVDELDSMKKATQSDGGEDKAVESSSDDGKEIETMKKVIAKLEKQIISQQDTIEENEKEAAAAKRDNSVLKQQAAGLEREYQRLADELEELKLATKKRPNETEVAEDLNSSYAGSSKNTGGLTQRRVKKVD